MVITNMKKLLLMLLLLVTTTIQAAHIKLYNERTFEVKIEVYRNLQAGYELIETITIQPGKHVELILNGDCSNYSYKENGSVMLGLTCCMIKFTQS